MICVILAGLLAWFVIFAFIDRPHVQTYKQRDAWRLLSGALMVALVYFVVKAYALHTELVFTIRQLHAFTD